MRIDRDFDAFLFKNSKMQNALAIVKSQPLAGWDFLAYFSRCTLNSWSLLHQTSLADTPPASSNWPPHF